MGLFAAVAQSRPARTAGLNDRFAGFFVRSPLSDLSRLLVSVCFRTLFIAFHSCVRSHLFCCSADRSGFVRRYPFPQPFLHGPLARPFCDAFCHGRFFPRSSFSRTFGSPLPLLHSRSFLETADRTRLNKRDKRFFPQECEALSVRSFFLDSCSCSLLFSFHLRLCWRAEWCWCVLPAGCSSHLGLDDVEACPANSSMASRNGASLAMSP